MTFAVIRELMNGYLFFLDLIVVLVLGSYLVVRQSHHTDDGWHLAFGLMLYVFGQGVNRWWLWRWWGALIGDAPSWSVVVKEVQADPTLIIGTGIIAFGLMYCIRVLMGSYWGRWSWIAAFALAVLVPVFVLLIGG